MLAAALIAAGAGASAAAAAHAAAAARGPAASAAPAAAGSPPATSAAPAARPRALRAVPGAIAGGRGRLPNGWLVSPAGRQVEVGDFPLRVAVSPDERLAAVVHSGANGHGVTLVDLDAGRAVQELPVAGAWLGAAFLDGGRTLVVSGGLSNRLLYYGVAGGRAALADSLALGPPWAAGGQYPQGRRADYGPGAIWPTALAADAARGRLYAVSRLDSALYVVDAARRTVLRRVPLPAVPYACVAARAPGRVYVSLWSAAAVAIVDADAGAVARVVPVGPHPCDLVESPDGRRLFVADANANGVSVVDLAAGRVRETLSCAATPREPPGLTPDGVALDAAGARLYVADAGANRVAVFDVRRPGAARPLGFVPVGWYPTALAMLPRHRALLVANGKGGGSAPSGPAPRDTSGWCHYPLYSPGPRGTLSLVPVPGAAALARLTARALAGLPAARPPRPRAALPPIRHVFYVIRENRTYDQVLGDLPQGDGDPSRCLFGARVTPNAHALAGDFVLLDNLYCDADGSADGHNWETAAYATDYVTTSVTSSPIYDYEGGNPLAYPGGGYLWDACRRRGVSVRSYGEFVFNPQDAGDSVRAAVPGLVGHVAPRYRGYDPTVSDLDRERAWEEEFDRYDRDGGLPRLSLIRLPNDHTEGTCSGRPTPRAHVAENDLALGRMVERISHSRYWRGALILVVEDDAASGADHVDAHRTVALAIGPWVRRRAVVGAFYTSVSVVRTIEDLLGLPRLSEFDARAPGMEAVFARRPDPTPYVHREPDVDVNETNVAGAYGQRECDGWDFRVADRAPAARLDEIVWRSVRGAGSEPPAPVHAALAARLRRE